MYSYRPLFSLSLWDVVREAGCSDRQAVPGRESARCEVKGYGRQKTYLDEYRGSEYSLAFLPKVEITLWVEDSRVEEVARTIVEVARTGRMGDGKIFVLPAGLGG